MTNAMHTPALSDALVSERQTVRWSIEAAADRLLMEADDAQLLRSIDVTVRGHLQVKPDRVAYRGEVRYARPKPMRYGIATTSTVWIAGTAGVIGKVTLCPTTMVGRGTVLHGCTGDGWHGHKATTARAERKVTRTSRATARKATGATAKRGPVVSWWSMSARSLPRRWERATTVQQDTAAMCEAILRTSSHDAAVELVPGHVVIVDTAVATVRRDEPNGRSYPIREYARRAALAGLTLD